MGKPVKNRSVADKVRKTKTATAIKNNPFEVKINRKKFDVLGRKGKHDVGLPGVSRSKAINKRKDTLLKEYQQKGKSNKFIDRRFGEYDTKMAPEDKILQRFAMERQRTHNKKDLYNLNEEEELTHYGQSLAELERLPDVGDSDSDSEEKGLLSAELTAAHFGGGGGLLRKKSEGDEDGVQKAKSRQELIEELIIKSKQEKRERQTQKEETQELTEKLDQDWRSIQSLLSHKTPKAERKEEPEKPKLEEYDMMVRELGFEMKAQPSERLKTAEELAREEQERLHALEADRLRRMQGGLEDPAATKPSHLSADDLNDGFILDGDDRKTLAYQDGQWNVGEEKEEEDEEDEEDEEAGEIGEEEGSEGEGEKHVEEEEEYDDDDDDDNDDDGSCEEESHSDLASAQGSEGEEEDEEREEEEGVEPSPPARPTAHSEEGKASQEAAKAELPYTFKAPNCYRDLKALLQGHSAEDQRLILERTQKCNHPSLAVGNKAKLQKLFGFLLEYVGELATRRPPELSTVNQLIPQIHRLCQLFPDAACKVLQRLLSDSAHSMEESIEVKGRAAFPDLDMLIYLKITALLFPTSDFRHPLTTPAFLYISQTLTKCVVSSLQEVCVGLVVCCLAVEFVSLSQRFVPELINFLLGLLHLAVPDSTSPGYVVAPPFRMQRKCSGLLLLTEAGSADGWSRTPLPLSAAQSLQTHGAREKDQLRLSMVDTCLDLVKRCSSLYKTLPSFNHIFQPIRTLLEKHLPVKTYPSVIQDLHKEVLEAISMLPSQHAPLVFEKKKPVPLKLLTPKIVQVLDYGRKRGFTKEQKESERLKHHYKREFKGALREIRKDSRFLAREKLDDIMRRDVERKRKVKALLGSLASQEGDCKALKRKRK